MYKKLCFCIHNLLLSILIYFKSGFILHEKSRISDVKPSRSIIFNFAALGLSFCLTSGVYAAPWVNLKLNYDYSSHNYNAEAVYIKTNGIELNDLEMPPIIMNNFTLVPAREILEALGAVVDWKKETEELFIAYEDDIAIIKINSSQANCNGVIKEMPVPFKLINNKTMVPVRFISEAFGFEVNWVNDERTIYINSPQKIESEPNYNTENKDVSVGIIGGADGPTSIYLNSNDSLAEISFGDDFYYDRNMRSLIISSSFIEKDSISELADNTLKKHYFTADFKPDSSFQNGRCTVNDENIASIDFINDNGKIIICFNEKNSVNYKVYEEGDNICIKPFT